MPKLEGLLERMNGVQVELDAGRKLVKSVDTDIDTILEAKFQALSARIEQTLRSIATESSSIQTTSASSVSQQALLTVNTLQQTLLNALTRITTEGGDNTKSLTDSIGQISNRTDVKAIAAQVQSLADQVGSLPKEFPLPKDVDLSGVSDDIQMLVDIVGSIKMPEMPDLDTKELMLQMTELLSRRVTRFKVERNEFGGIDTIIATEEII